MFVADEHLLGYLPLQNRRFQEEGLPLDARHCVYAVRVGARHGVTEDGSGQLGHHDVQKAGDVLSGYLWEREGVRRPCHAWSFAWAAAAVGKAAGAADPHVRARPADERYRADGRFAIPEDVALPPTGRVPAGGEVGMVVLAAREDEQRGVWLSGCDCAVSQWRGPRPAEHSTVVQDVGPDDELSTLHAARLSTGLHVGHGVRGAGSADPLEPRPPAILAWNLTADPGDGVGQGFVVVREAVLEIDASATVVEPPKRGSVSTVPESPPGRPARLGLGARVYAHASWERGGPLNAGHPGDQHVIGFNADGEEVRPAHLGVNALFVGGLWDCPLEFRQEEYPGAARFPWTAEVHLTVDERSTHSWIAAVDDVRSGAKLGRWFSFTPFRPPSGGDREGGCGDKTGDPKGGGRRGGGDGEPPPDPLTAVLPERLELLQTHDPSSPRCGVRPVEASNELCRPAVAGKAQRPWVHGEDLRYDPVLDDEQKETLDELPVVTRGEAFGTVESLTTRPGASRYASGTAVGGWAVLPPELDVADLREGESDRLSQAQAEGVSAAQYWIGPGVSLVFGDDWNDRTGLVQGGFAIQQVGGDLQISTISSAGVRSDVARVDQDGHWEFQVGTRHPIRTVNDADTAADQFDHSVALDAITADRNLTLPDATQFTGLVLELKHPPGPPGKKVFVQPVLGQTIDGAASHTLNKGEAATVKSNGNNWLIF